MIRPLLVLAVLALSAADGAAAQVRLSDLAVAAEGRGQWDEALSLYATLLEQRPGQADIWVRVADIHAHRGRVGDAVQALRHAVEAKPDEPSLRHRLSQAYAAAGDASAALVAVRAALTLRPDDVAYIQSAAILSTWAADYTAAQQYYRRLYALGHDVEVLLKLGRVSAWRGDTDSASNALQKYLDGRPESREGWLDLARVETWRGNATGAFRALEQYRVRFGDSPEYQSTLARSLVAAGRPNKAIEVLEPLMSGQPATVDLLVVNTLAHTLREDPRAARAALDSLQRLDRANPETRQAEHVLRATLGSRVEPRVSVSSDSDHLYTARTGSSGSLRLPGATRISAGYERTTLRAPRENGLGLSTGGQVTRTTVWSGVTQTLGPATVLARLGDARWLDHRLTEYAIAARVRASDALSARLEHGRNLLAVSPRTLELGLTQQEDHFQVLWTPRLRLHVTTAGTLQRISDGNEQWTVTLAPRYDLVRTARLNLDIGASAYQLHTSHDEPNGYYDPHAYESYTATVHPYFKVSDNVGVSASASFGGQRERGSRFRPGGSGGVEATVGIYQAWLLSAAASATDNQRLASGAYRGVTASLTLVRRF
jgi:tetratricopeptide (TPR) repeat protein